MTEQERRERYMSVSDKLMEAALSALDSITELTAMEAAMLMDIAIKLSDKGNKEGGCEDGK